MRILFNDLIQPWPLITTCIGKAILPILRRDLTGYRAGSEPTTLGSMDKTFADNNIC